MNNIYRVIQNNNGIDTVIGHFNSKIVASIVLYQLNHRKNAKMKYMKDHKITSKFEPDIRKREYFLDTVSYDDSDFQSVIKKESSVGQLKKLIYAK